VVADVADSVVVMYAGRVVEAGRMRNVLTRPAHPYTLSLLRSAPQARRKGEKLLPIIGSPPDVAHLPEGCAFHPRCPLATEICLTVRPPRIAVAPGRDAECHHAEKVHAEASVDA
jgi:oligopeptide transport system ATP-binding protein